MEIKTPIPNKLFITGKFLDNIKNHTEIEKSDIIQRIRDDPSTLGSFIQEYLRSQGRPGLRAKKTSLPLISAKHLMLKKIRLTEPGYKKLLISIVDSKPIPVESPMDICKGEFTVKELREAYKALTKQINDESIILSSKKTGPNGKCSEIIAAGKEVHLIEGKKVWVYLDTNNGTARLILEGNRRIPIGILFQLDNDETIRNVCGRRKDKLFQLCGNPLCIKRNHLVLEEDAVIESRRVCPADKTCDHIPRCIKDEGEDKNE